MPRIKMGGLSRWWSPLSKARIAEEYNASAPLYDSRYTEEQQVKAGFLLNRVRLCGGEVVIDAGCGTGILLEIISKRAAATLVGLDSSIGMLREARRKGINAELVLGDIEHMPFRDGAADAVFSISVIQLAEDPRAALEEMRRVLKVGGSLAVSYLRRAGISIPEVDGLETAVHDSETMKDIFITGYRKS